MDDRAACEVSELMQAHFRGYGTLLQVTLCVCGFPDQRRPVRKVELVYSGERCYFGARF